MAITTLDGLAAAAKFTLPFSINTLTAVAGAQYSLWLAAGFLPAVHAAPGAAAVPGASLAGLGTWPAAAGAAKTYLSRVSLMGTVAGTLVIYDRLSHVSGIAGAVGSQTVDTAAITRGGPSADTTGNGVEGFLETYGALTGGGVNTVGWTDHGGTARSSATATIAAAPASRLFPIPLVTGATGIRSIQTSSVATAVTAGNFGFTLARRLLTVPISLANTGPVTIDPLTLGLPPLDDNTCLWFTFISTTTSTGVIQGEIQLAQG
jgi:hypothetical protein